MEDFVTWVDSSKLKRTIMAYNDEVRALPSLDAALADCIFFFSSSTTSICSDHHDRRAPCQPDRPLPSLAPPKVSHHPSERTHTPISPHGLPEIRPPGPWRKPRPPGIPTYLLCIYPLYSYYVQYPDYPPSTAFEQPSHPSTARAQAVIEIFDLKLLSQYAGQLDCRR